MNEYENIYFTDKYQNSLNDCIAAVSGKCAAESVLDAGFGYSLWCGEYSGREKTYLKCRLFSPEGKAVFGYNVNYDDAFPYFTQIFDSGNGEKYFIFKEDLYGYSMVRLSDMQSVRYMPRGDEKTGESFIFTDFHYCAQTKIAAAGGCFWAAPYDIAFLDLTEPLKTPEKLTLLFPLINPECDYDLFSDIDFLRWEKGGRLIAEAEGKAGREQLAFSAEDIRRFMEL